MLSIEGTQVNRIVRSCGAASASQPGQGGIIQATPHAVFWTTTCAKLFY